MVAVIDFPKALAIGFWNGEGLDLLPRVERKAAFVDGLREGLERLRAIEEKHKPVALSLVGFFGSHAKKVQILFRDAVAGFFEGFADGAFVGRFAGGHFQFSADGAPESVVGSLGSLDHEEATFGVLEEDEHADFVLHVWHGHGVGRSGCGGASGNSGEDGAEIALARRREQGESLAMARVVRRLVFGVLAVWLWTFSHGAEVSLQGLSFRLANAPFSDDRWYEAEVELDVAKGREADRRESRFANAVRVEATIAVEVESDGGGRGYAFYQADVELVALEVGRHGVRFYLPPEIVARDRVRGEPMSYRVRVQAEGAEPEVFYSRNLGSPGAKESFETLAAEGVAATKGILRPQHLSPFRDSYPGRTPTARIE